MKRTVLVAVMGMALVAFVAQPILAKKEFLEEFKKAYPNADPKLQKCTTCHTPSGNEKPGKKNLNLYGKDLQSSDEAKPAMGKDKKASPEDLKAVAAGIKAIGSKQSNGNGKSNDDNIKAGVNPGVK